MTTLPAWAARLLRRELECAAGGVSFDREAALKLLTLLAPRRKNEKQKATQKRKLQGALAARATSAELRAKVLERALASSGGCELCGGPGALEMHHLERGSGRRREHQAVENCMGICGFCHREYHRDPKQFFGDIESWAKEHGYPLPSIIRKAEASAQLPGRAAR
jgi:5-methylcytosine-specific restriction endonuclease McrA